MTRQARETADLGDEPRNGADDENPLETCGDEPEPSRARRRAISEARPRQRRRKTQTNRAERSRT